MNLLNLIFILRAVAAVVAVGKRLNDGAADVVVAGVNENVGAVVGLVVGKPNDEPTVVVGAPGNIEVGAAKENLKSFFFFY